MQPEEKKEIFINRQTTIKLGIGILLTILAQTAIFSWIFSARFTTLENQTKQNTADIAELRSTSAVIITRDDLAAILAGPAEQIAGLRRDVNRLDTKLDQVLKEI